MNIEPISEPVRRFLSNEAMGFASAVEFGAGRFEKIASIDAPKRAGIEIFEPYILDFQHRGVTPILGDMRDFEPLIADCKLDPFGVALLIDSLEHVYHGEGVSLLQRLKGHCEKILVFCPRGPSDQQEDAWGYGNHYHQSHKSEWWERDLEALDFRVTVVENFHRPGDAMFAVWP